MKNFSKFFLIVTAIMLQTFICYYSANATQFVSDLSIFGNVSFDTAFTDLYPADNVAQSGNFYVRQGGIDSTSTFSGKAVTGANPQVGFLSDFGDGFGITANVSSTYASSFGLGNNIVVNLANTSSTTSYIIKFTVDFLNSLNVAGDNSYAHSNYYIRDASNNDIFYTDVTRDTVFGDMDFNLPDNFFDVLLMPNATTQLKGYWTLDGGVFTDPGTANVDFRAFLSIQDVTSSQPPAIPEPSTIVLLGTGLAALGLLRRRSR